MLRHFNMLVAWLLACLVPVLVAWCRLQPVDLASDPGLSGGLVAIGVLVILCQLMGSWWPAIGVMGSLWRPVLVPVLVARRPGSTRRPVLVADGNGQARRPGSWWPSGSTWLPALWGEGIGISVPRAGGFWHQNFTIVDIGRSDDTILVDILLISDLHKGIQWYTYRLHQLARLLVTSIGDICHRVARNEKHMVDTSGLPGLSCLHFPLSATLIWLLTICSSWPTAFKGEIKQWIQISTLVSVTFVRLRLLPGVVSYWESAMAHGQLRTWFVKKARIIKSTLFTSLQRTQRYTVTHAADVKTPHAVVAAMCKGKNAMDTVTLGKQLDPILLHEMMICPACGALYRSIAEADEKTRTWQCLTCGHLADPADFDPGFDDQATADIGAEPDTRSFGNVFVTCPSCDGGSVVWTITCPICQNEGRISEDLAPETKWTGTVNGKHCTGYCIDQAEAEYKALMKAHVGGFTLTLQQWARFDPGVFTIPDSNLPALKKRIDKLNRKAKQLEADPVDLAFMGQVIERRSLSEADRLANRKHVIHCTVLRITGNRIKLAGGWTFVGTLEHTEAGNILRTVPGENIPGQFRHVDPTCDHCQLDRKRNDTFIVKDENGHHLQIGRTCLKDYLGHRSPGLVAAFYTSLAEFMADMKDDEFWSDGLRPTGYPAPLFLVLTAASIRLWGWTSRSKASDYSNATADDVEFWLRSLEKHPGLADYGLADKDGHLMYTPGNKPMQTCPADFELATAALQWARTLADDDLNNDYLWNLHIVAQQDDFLFRQVGLAASMVSAYQRTLAKALERENRPESNWLGTVKKRQIWSDLLLVDVKTWESDWGVTYFHVFHDPDGNVLTWKTGTVYLDQGQTYAGKATVKDHDSYDGTKQTALARANFEVQASN